MVGRVAHPKAALQSVTVVENLPVRRSAIAALFVLLHAMAISYSVQTAGQPYLAALEQQAKLDNATNATQLNATESLLANATALDVEGEPAASATDTKTPARAEAAAEAKPAAASGFGFGDEEWEEDDVGGAGGATVLNTTDNATLPAFNETKKERPLPHEWLPSALACALLFLSVTANVFFYLMCHWSTAFKVRALFAPTGTPAVGKFLRFMPMPHKGRPAIVKLTESKRTGRLTCEYQRQRFELLPMQEALDTATKADGELASLEGSQWAVRLMRCPTDLAYSEYSEHGGLPDEEAVEAAGEKFGTNVISVPTPRFLDLYYEQLLSPLVIFQLFTSALWLLDAVSIGFTIFQVTNPPSPALSPTPRPL